MNLLDGKATSAKIKQEITEKVNEYVNKGFRPPHLVAIIAGNDGASETYVGHKEKACAQVGFTSEVIRYPENVEENTILKKIVELNNDKEIDGFIVQLPLPKQVNEQKIIETIAPEKDVDGFHPVNLGKMMAGLPSFVSATPKGIVELLRHNNLSVSGKHCVVIGRSNIVGRPVSVLLSQNNEYGNATVTLCHSRTKNLKDITKQADVLVVSMGKPNFVTADMVKNGAIVVDVGITRIKSDKTKSGFKLVGDVDFENVAPKSSYITPVPGGVGPMTIVSLLLNTWQAYLSNIK
ncbi:MAG TPA: bifunctional methylenetetrahydrofolate dehydrogenase/methenyltetrahydrofolate cyclohydrolase FolD [Bacteroidales bacterium]|jgi:methylenetetrahydrofolate dehydrogenase (NADP+)/methenyltetrahydrofolate cyclohydrolase|nr:bifunctional methylenetetrahydrofolate dehydrogenase/methenyltetrahydrofolate cyclohydrolase FolD [Bacteroidales bacterium]HXK82592.1 bifunctional methylenetetrahydrofolate dehydrogenase/methenyltetrahydrofolate cyclohydrolase FolD [Bacteroidales bacterium]